MSQKSGLQGRGRELERNGLYSGEAYLQRAESQQVLVMYNFSQECAFLFSLEKLTIYIVCK